MNKHIEEKIAEILERILAENYNENRKKAAAKEISLLLKKLAEEALPPEKVPDICKDEENGCKQCIKDKAWNSCRRTFLENLDCMVSGEEKTI